MLKQLVNWFSLAAIVMLGLLALSGQHTAAQWRETAMDWKKTAMKAEAVLDKHNQNFAFAMATAAQMNRNFQRCIELNNELLAGSVGRNEGLPNMKTTLTAQ